jgi:hypothetical protein
MDMSSSGVVVRAGAASAMPAHSAITTSNNQRNVVFMSTSARWTPTMNDGA